MLKKLIATAIISLGISGAAYFVMREAPISVPSLNTSPTQTQKSNNPVLGQSAQSKPFVEKLMEKLPFKSEENPKDLASENLTNELIQSLAGNIVRQNPSGPETIEGKSWLNVNNPEDIANQLIAEAAQKFDPESLKPVIDENKLKIIGDNSQASLLNYLISLGTIILNSSNKIPATILEPENLSVDVLNQAIGVYENTIEKIYDLRVPQLALDIHKKELSLFGAAKNSLEKITNYEKDPLTAMLVAKNLISLDSQFNDLKKEIAEFIQNNNIK